MFGALGRLASRHPWYVIAAWVVFAVVVVLSSPGLKPTTDQSDFLPRHYESIKAAELQQKAFPEQRQPAAIVVFSREDGGTLTDADNTKVTAIVDGLQDNLGTAFSGIQAIPQTGNGKVLIAAVGLDDAKSTGFDQTAFDSVVSLRDDLTDATKGTDLNYGVTGSAASSYDSQEASKNAEAIVSAATVLLIVVLLSIIFRSVLITVMPLVVVALSAAVANGLIAWANKAFDLKIDNSVEIILVVVLFGIGTDYILFFLFRYRERLREGEETRGAVAHALERAGEAIASAGGAVIVAFMALILSSLGIFKAIGPALAIAVAVTLVAALTLVPALSTVLRGALFWPSKKWREEPKSARFALIGRHLGARPGRYALVSGGLLAVLSIFAFQFAPTFDLSSSGVPETAESSKALVTLEKGGYSAGATDPTLIYLHSTNGQPLGQDAMAEFGTALSAAPGVADVSAPVPSADGQTALFSTTLTSEPSSDTALANVKGPIRDAAHQAAPDGTEALVGGTTSIFVDFQAAMNRDYSVVFPVAAIVIMLILALLLRSLVAPLYLMASVGLGFGATLGATVIVFQLIKGDDGLIFILPIYMYLFVVALGTDYNILMIARLREEARSGLSSRDAAAQAVKHAGPTIAAAGLILSGTFASLMLAGNSLLVTLGFAISFGIFVAAFV
ncbi:MAG TPA: MMPL family transporter, partial [Kribbella sp.]|nr:MMPL family transporter [Kribbella sp.]